MPRKIERSPGPTKATLRKYGMNLDHWLELAIAQGFTCPVCGQPFGERKLAIDHAHVKGFRKMAPSGRRLHVRGVLHSFCNRYVRGWLTLARAKSIVDYLEAHLLRSAPPKAVPPVIKER